MWGLLYEMSDEAMARLDEISGVDQGFYKQIAVEIERDGQTIPAVTYVIPDASGPFRPPASYTRPILVGARALGLPQEYVAQLEKIIQAAEK